MARSVPAAGGSGTLPDLDHIQRILDRVRERGDAVLVEPDGFPLLEAAGIRCARHLLVDGSDAAARLDASAQLPGDRVVVKVASPRILHRSDVGGVAVVPNDRAVMAAAIADMERRLPAEGRLGFTLNEFVPHDSSIGTELLVGLRHTDDFGPVVSLGAGGIYAEFLARHFRPGDDLAILPACGASPDAIARRLGRLPVVRLLTGGLRGQRARVSLGAVVEVVEAFAALGRAFVPAALAECEVNPLAVATDGSLVALDVLARLGNGERPARAPRPLRKLAHLLTPARVAIIGVSEGMNPGRVILRNLLREGFPAANIVVVKPGSDAIDGCRCVPDLAAIDRPVDLLVLAVGAAQVPGIVSESITRRTAESMIVIPGGLEEKAGTRHLLEPMYEALAGSRGTPWEGPVINGGNCLGIRSLPGRIDTMFIPAPKMPARSARVSRVALLSQSGAFAISRSSKLASLNPRFVVTVGNQMDLTIGDHLTWLAADREVEVFAVYVEGFRPMDGARFLAASRDVVASGRTVVLYRAGRTAAGAAASASHTASIAGDYAVTRELASAAGVLVAETIQDFEDLVTLSVAFRDKAPAGARLGAVSNAGFECVAIADNLGGLTLPDLSGTTRERIEAVLRRARIDRLVDVHNPLDLTPMAADDVYEETVRLVLDDAGVDVGLVGCVPLTPALRTLPPSPAHGEDVAAPDSVASRLAAVFTASSKPFALVIDSGRQYDPMAERLEQAGVPVFRSADRALRLLDLYVASTVHQRNACGDRAPSLA